MNLLLDVAKLERGQRHHDHHQDHRLRRRAAEIGADLAVLKHLVDQRLRGAVGAAAGRGVDDAERVEEHVGDVDDDQEEGGRRQQRKDDGPEPPHRPGAVDRGGLDHAFRDRLQTCEEEQEIVADLVPDRDDDHEDHRMRPVQHRIPVDAVALHARARSCRARAGT